MIVATGQAPSRVRTGQRLVRRLTLAVALFIVAFASSNIAQTELNGGLMVPVDFNGKPPQNVSISGDYGTSVGFWADGVFPATRAGSPPLGVKAPANVVVVASLEVPLSYERSYRHPGTAGYIAQLEHRDMVISGLVGFTSGSPRARTQVLVGGGLAFARLSGNLLPTGFHQGEPPTSYALSETEPVIAGGVEQRIQIGQRLALLVGCRLRFMFRSDEMQRHGINTSLSIAPRVGVVVPF